jgi:bifunctional non-homologous end joining protein LigD
MSSSAASELAVGGRRLAIPNLRRIVLPQTGTTKGELLDYYVRIADAMLPHLRDRLLHLHRYPEGVEGPRFWQKACPDHRPAWLPTAPVWSGAKRANIDFCVVNELAALLWAVNIGRIELHTSLHLRHDLHPTNGACVRPRSRRRRSTGPLLRRRAASARAARRSGPAVARQDIRFQAVAGLRPAQFGRHLRGDEACGTGDRGAPRGPDTGVGRVAHGEGASGRQGPRRLEPEHRAQVDGVRLFRTREATSHRLDPLRWKEVERAVDLGDAASLVFEMADVGERVAKRGDLFEPVLTTRQEFRAAGRQPPP